jgi:hypothetical protein
MGNLKVGALVDGKYWEKRSFYFPDTCPCHPVGSRLSGVGTHRWA